MMVSYWMLPGSQRGGLTSPRSVRRCSVLISDGLPRQFHALQDTPMGPVVRRSRQGLLWFMTYLPDGHQTECPCSHYPRPLSSLIVAGVEQGFTSRRRELVAHDEFPEPREEGRSLGVEHLYIVDMDRMRPDSFSFDDPLKFDPAIQRLQERRGQHTGEVPSHSTRKLLHRQQEPAFLDVERSNSSFDRLKTRLARTSTLQRLLNLVDE